MTQRAPITIPRLSVPVADGPPPFDPTVDRVVHEWRDRAGTTVAYSAERGEIKVVHLLGVATYRFRVGEDVVEAVPVEAAANEAIREGYFRAALPFILQAHGVQTIHASAVDSPHGLVLISGVSGSGKSTVAFGLDRRGMEMFADDVVAFRPLEESVVASPLPFSVRLTPDTANYYFPEAPAQTAKFVPPNRTSTDRSPRPVAVGLTLTPERSGEVPMRAVRLDPAAVLTELLSHAYCFDPDRVERKRTLVTDYLALAARVPFFQLTLGAGVEDLEERLDRIEELLLEVCDPTPSVDAR